MDFAPTEGQQAIRELARTLLATPDPWPALVESGILELDDLLDVTTLLIEVGRSGAHVPALESLAFGWPARRPGAPITAGILEDSGRDLLHPSTLALDGRLYGAKICVPAVDRSTHLVVTAADGVWLVRLADCVVEPQVGTNGDPLGRVTLAGAPGERLGGPELVRAWLPRIHVGLAALHYGLASRALELTADYVKTREQFGRKIGQFQAVAHRAADAWIDLQAMEVTLWQAAWRVQQGLPADREVAIARYWAAEGSHRIVAAAQHLHGGMGFDRDYPLYRYFLTSKQWEFALGGARATLADLGRFLAGEHP